MPPKVGSRAYERAKDAKKRGGGGGGKNARRDMPPPSDNFLQLEEEARRKKEEGGEDLESSYETESESSEDAYTKKKNQKAPKKLGGFAAIVAEDRAGSDSDSDDSLGREAFASRKDGLTKKERLALEEQRVKDARLKAAQSGKGKTAQGDLARLQEIRARREAAAKKRVEEEAEKERRKAKS